MISKTMEQALNKQANREFYSAYLYLSMSSHFENTTLKGFAHWMRVQAKEEQSHGLKMYDFLIAEEWQGYAPRHRSAQGKMVFCR